MNKKSYVGIDYFRVIAAILVVAIHTSPLVDISEICDFAFTRIIARVAVPFFFVTSGYFVISRYAHDSKRLMGFLKKTAIIYGVSILIYIPINIYNSYFSVNNLLPNIIKDIVFDGTIYHLWYLPASMMGAAIAWYLIKKIDYNKAFIVTGILYVIGLLGDSYYGLAYKLSIEGFYKLLFQVSDYTRNGILFAPIFFVIGAYMADSSMKNSNKMTVSNKTIGFILSFIFMFAEAFMVYNLDFIKHDSMYVMLPVCIYFLFSILLEIKGKRINMLRDISLVIYIIHPMMIVVLRLAARILHLENLLIENNLIHFIVVLVMSVVFAIVYSIVWNKFKTKFLGKHKKDRSGNDRAYMEIDLENLSHNVSVLEAAMKDGCKLMAVVKAEAYGHGMYAVAEHLDKIGVNSYAVATIDEAINLRKFGVSGEILILGYTPVRMAYKLKKYNITQTLVDYDYAVALNNEGYHIKAHIKVDTDMHRLGYDKNDIDSIVDSFKFDSIEVTGVYTHLCVADSLDESDVAFTKNQIKSFENVKSAIVDRGIMLPKTHIQSSYGLLNYPELHSDYVRVGIALYGVLSALHDKVKLNLDLKPVFALKSKVALLRKVKKGESIGYSRAFVTERDSLIAILPIGYADGYPRNLSGGKANVLINGQKAPIIGRICMDQMAVDVTDVKDVKVGMVATLIGKDGDEEITATMVAEQSETITNELLSRMGQRLQHRVK